MKNNRLFTRMFEALKAWSEKHDFLIDCLVGDDWDEYRANKTLVGVLEKNFINRAKDYLEES